MTADPAQSNAHALHANAPQRAAGVRADRKQPAETAHTSVAAFERRLHVRRRGRQEGAADLPPTSSLIPSQVEQDIAAAMLAERERISLQRDKALSDLERALRRAAPMRPSLTAVLGAAEADLLRVEGRLRRPFGEARAADARTQAQLDGFRARHGLERPAVFPDSIVLAAAMLFFAAAIEASFSATLFANASDSGLLGGASIALGLSAANVALGFLTGFLGLRYLQHRRWPQRLLGALCAATATAGALGLNLYAAMWREQAEGQAGAAAEAGVETGAGAMLLGLSRPEAVILLMLGLAVWVFSTLKGFSGFDDPYPDYGKFARAAQRSQDDVGFAREELRAALDAPVDKARDAVEAAVGGVAAAAASMRAAYEAGADRIALLDGEEIRLAATSAALVALYRQENTEARTSPAPLCFAAEPLAPPPPASGLDAAAAMLLKAEETLESLHAEAAAGLKRLAGAAEAAAARLEEAV